MCFADASCIGMRWQEGSCMVSMSAAHRGENVENSSTSTIEMEKTRLILRADYNLHCCLKAITFAPPAD